MSEYLDKKAERDKRHKHYMNALLFPGFLSGICNYNGEVGENIDYDKETKDTVQQDAPTQSVMDDR